MPPRMTESVMAFNEGILADLRPNFFELLAEEEMHESLRPAVEYVCKVHTHTRRWCYVIRMQLSLLYTGGLPRQAGQVWRVVATARRTLPLPGDCPSVALSQSLR